MHSHGIVYDEHEKKLTRRTWVCNLVFQREETRQFAVRTGVFSYAFINYSNNKFAFCKTITFLPYIFVHTDGRGAVADSETGLHEGGRDDIAWREWESKRIDRERERASSSGGCLNSR